VHLRIKVLSRHSPAPAFAGVNSNGNLGSRSILYLCHSGLSGIFLKKGSRRTSLAGMTTREKGFMKRFAGLLSLLFVLLTLYGLPAFAKERCRECGMKVDESSPFASYALLKDGEKLYFCDIGDMLVHVLKKKKIGPDSVFVKDYAKGEWMDAKHAFFVHSKKFSSPMGWGIGAFKNKDDALSYGNKVYDFSGALSLIE